MFPSPTRSCVLAAAFSTAAVWFPIAQRALGGVINPSLPPGSEYQLIFVTSGGRDALSGNIADYNAFVTAQAALNPDLPAGVTWSAVGSTALVAARDNAPSQVGVPIYNTAGQLLTSGTSDLYHTWPLLAAPCYDQNGVFESTGVWTGSMDDGAPFNPLGTISGGTGVGGGESVGLGFSNYPASWLEGTVAAPTNQFNLYALSSTITVPVPEPSTLALFGTGAAALFAARFRRYVARSLNRR